MELILKYNNLDIYPYFYKISIKRIILSHFAVEYNPFFAKLSFFLYYYKENDN